MFRQLVLCVLLGAAAMAARAQTAVLYQGEPALACHYMGSDVRLIVRGMNRGEAAFEFEVRSGGQPAGLMAVGPTTVRLVAMPTGKVASFEVPRASVTAEFGHGHMGLGTPAGNYDFFLQVRPEKELQGRVPSLDKYPACDRFLSLAFTDFAEADKQFRSLSAPLQPAATESAVVAANPHPVASASAPVVKTGSLHVVTDPGGVQIYLDDEPKGMSSPEGHLVLKDLTPGTYRVRASLIGYQQSIQSVTVAAGEDSRVTTKLETAGPKPLTETEIEEALTNGVSKARVTALVKQYGVDFVLTPELQQRLGSKGADDGLLLAIATHKR